MCGIFAYTGSQTDAPVRVLNGLKRLEYRGYDSWGIASQCKVQNEKCKIEIRKKIGKIGNATVDDFPPSTIAFGHTRWATHGGVTVANAHPHSDCSGKIALIHNGIIENYETLKKKLIEQGHTFISETDTEVAVHLIEEYAKTQAFDEAVRLAFLEFTGLNAIIAWHVDNDYFVAVRNSSPLVLGFGKDGNYIASDASALLPHTREVYFLEDNEMAIVKPDEISVKNVVTNTDISIQPQTLSWSIEQAEKGQFPHFMLKEIHEQPELLKRIAATSDETINEWANRIKNAQGTYFVGCGTAAHACIAASYIFSKVAKTHINWAHASEFGYHLDFLTDKSLIIALSQSGETMDTLEALKKVAEKKSTIGALVNVEGSSLYRMANHSLLLNAGPEKAVASTKVFTAMVGYVLLIAYALAGKLDEGKKILNQTAEELKGLIANGRVTQIKKIAHDLAQKEHLYVIGRGLSYPTALESALKIKEISYIHAEGFAAGELKHGVIALIEEGTPCLVFAPKDETHHANLAGAMEMKARGGMIIGVAPHNHDVFDEHIQIADCNEASIIPNVVVGQLLAYFMTCERGLDPDMPRNLAKSVTVK